MAGITQTTLGDLLINVYDKGTITQLQNLEVPLLEQISDAADYTVGGKNLFFAVNASGDEGYGYIQESGALPQAQNEQVLQAQVSPKIYAGTVKITGLARAISTGSALAFANGLQYHFDEKLKRMTRYEETVLFRAGTGILGLINEPSSVPDTTTAVDVDGPGAQWLRRNMLVDIRNVGSGNLVVEGAKITDSDQIANTFTLDTDLSGPISDNDQIFLHGTQPGGALVEREKLGLEAAIAATGTYLNINRATIPEWEGNVIAAGATDIDEDRLLQAQNRILIVGGIPNSDIRMMKIIIHPNQTRKYFETVVPQRQFTGTNFELGFSKLSWNGHEFLQTYNCQRTKIWMGNMQAWNRYSTPGGNMQIDQTFGPPIKWANGFDAGIAYWRSYEECAIKKPNAWCLIDDVNDVQDM